MPKEIRMPKLSDTMEEGRLLQWRKREGDPVRRGEVLADIETDKADMEFESYTEGVIHKLVIAPGTTVPVGTLIAIIRLPEESEQEAEAALQAAVGAAAAPPAAAAAPVPAAGTPVPAAPAPPPGTPAMAPPPTAAVSPAPAAASPGGIPAPAAVLPPPASGQRVAAPLAEDGRLRATPRARRLAEERSVDLTEVEGSGPGGAIVHADVEAYLRELEQQVGETEGVRATPLALRMGTELGVDLEAVKGSGPAGRITKADLLAHLEREKHAASEREAELFRGALQLSQKRKALIRNMIRSKAEAPHFYVQMDARTETLQALRDRLNAAAGEGRPRLTYTHLIMKAAALALERFDDVNATYRPDQGDIALYQSINIGLAVDVDDELVAPTVKDCRGKDVFRLAEEANALIQRARLRKLQPQDYADGTFTISNLGMFGVDRFYAIITPPQSTILAVSAIRPRAIVEEGEVRAATVTTLGLSVDHRVVDGVKAAQFLGEIKRLLESPEELGGDGHGSGS